MRIWFIVLFAALGFAVPAQAQSTVDPEHIGALLKDAGYPTEFVGDEPGYRSIVTKGSEYGFTVEFYDCNAGKACELLVLRTTFRKDDKLTKEAVDAYSSQQPAGRTFIDRRGNPTIELEFDLVDTTLTDEQFTDTLKTWDTMLLNYAAFLSGNPTPAPAATPPAPGAESPPAAPATS